MRRRPVLGRDVLRRDVLRLRRRPEGWLRRRPEGRRGGRRDRRAPRLVTGVAGAREPRARSFVPVACHGPILPDGADGCRESRIGNNGPVTGTDPATDLPVSAVAADGGPEAAPAPDAVLAAAVDLAREYAREMGGAAVGDHLAVIAEGDAATGILATHAFVAVLPGYTGWYWAVTLARAPESDVATVDEVVLLPGADALLAPAWVPWEERLRPGDLSPGDLLPPRPDDPRLVPAYVDSGDPLVEDVAFELGLGRERVMSREGRLDAAERWYAGDSGPDTPMARQAPAHCGTCGFLLPLAGSLRAGFGVCGNEITATDGRVVSVEYGCGAHSQVEIVVPPLAEPSGDVYDDGDEIVEVRAAAETGAEAAGETGVETAAESEAVGPAPTAEAGAESEAAGPALPAETEPETEQVTEPVAGEPATEATES